MGLLAKSVKPNLECPAPELSRETRAASRAGGWRRKRGAGVGGAGDEGHREVSCVGLLSKDQMIGGPMWPHVDQAMPGPPKSPWDPGTSTVMRLKSLSWPGGRAGWLRKETPSQVFSMQHRKLLGVRL